MSAAWLLCGVLLALWTPGPLQTPLTWLMAGVAAALLLSPWKRVGVILLAGFLYAQFSAGQILSAHYDCEERRLVLARIATIPAATEEGWQFDAWVRPLREQQRELRVRLSYPGAIAPRAREQWQLLVQFEAADSGADAIARRQLLRDHISARARVRASPLNRRVAAAAPSIDALRERVASRIAQRVADPSAAGLLAALAVGVTGDVSASQWRVFNASGITHLVAISGMHVTFFAMLCMGLARLIWRRWPGPPLPVRRESFAAVTGVILAFAYALLSGFSVPAQRTAVMLAAFLAARCCGRVTTSSWSVAASLAAVLLFDPLSALSAGFWLSFCAVSAIVFFAGGQLSTGGSLRTAVHVQWVVTIALLPVTILLFGSFSLIGPLVNAVAIPLFSFALVPPLLLATALYLLPGAVGLHIADLLVTVAGWLATAGWPLLARSTDWSQALLTAQPGIWWLCLAVPAVLAVLLPVPTGLRALAGALLCCAFLSRPARPANGELEIRLLDVGASRALLLKTRRHQLLLGTGESFGGGGRRFESRVLPELLRSRASLDLLLLERADRDSLQGLLRADARMHVREVLIAGTDGAPPELPRCAGRSWRWDSVEFTLQESAGSCWISARTGARTFLAVAGRAEAGPGAGAEVMLLPPTPREAAPMLQDMPAEGIALVSTARRDWQSPSWRKLRQGQDGARRIFATAGEGALRVVLRAQGAVKVQRLSRGTPGIWSVEHPGAQCRRVPEARL
jgi:competence protein ComEC